jgi:hypothetical protein
MISEIQPLHAQQDISEEGMLNLFPPDPTLLVTNVHLPSVKSHFSQNRLCLGSCEGATIDAPALLRQANDELGKRLGGLFALDLRPWLKAHSSLVPAALIAQFQRPGFSLTIDTPRQAYYHMAFSWRGWSVYALGEPMEFHGVFLGRRCSASEALAVNGGANVGLWPELAAMLKLACPRLDWQSFKDRSNEFEPNQFIQFRESDGLTLKAGVRTLSQEQWTPEVNYFFGLRINW